MTKMHHKLFNLMNRQNILCKPKVYLKLMCIYLNYRILGLRWWIKKFQKYSYFEYTTELYKTNPVFAMMLEWCSTQGEMWRHRLMPSCDSDPAKKMTEISFPIEKLWQTFTCRLESLFLLKRAWLSIIGTNNPLTMQFWIC